MSNDTVTQSNKTHFSPKELRDFGLIMAGMLILMFGFVLPWIFSYSTPYWPFIAAIVFAVVALLRPVLLGPVNRVWLKISDVSQQLRISVDYLVKLELGAFDELPAPQPDIKSASVIADKAFISRWSY